MSVKTIDLKSTMKIQLERARSMTQNVIKGFQTREQWLYRPHDRANHALWVVGHLALADNFMASQFQPDCLDILDGAKEKYWMATTPSSEDGANLPTDVVLDYFEDRRKNLLRVFEESSMEDLQQEMPADSPFSSFPFKGYIFAFNSFHEGVHLGQLTVCHRGIGCDPLFVPEPEESEA